MYRKMSTDRQSGAEFMKRRFPVALVIATFLSAPGLVCADTLNEALAFAYHNNPTLLARRAALAVADETVSQALSAWRPSVSFSGDIGKRYSSSRSKGGGTRDTYLAPGTMALRVSQTLYGGGRTGAATLQKENQVLAAREELRATEQTVLLQAATSYMNVLRDAAVVELRENNLRVLGRQLEAIRDRFEVGEVTRTDVSQAEARLAGAQAGLISGLGQLETSKAGYERVIGKIPEMLRRPEPLTGMPADEQEAVAIALERAPALRAANFTMIAAEANINLVKGELEPVVSLDGAYEREWERAADQVRADKLTAKLKVTVPIYQQGAVHSRVRAAMKTAGQRRIQVEEARRGVVETATRAWERLVTAQASIVSLDKKVEASNIALEGVGREADVGSRTVLDVLNAEQELLQARVDLVSSERDFSVAAYEVKSAIGDLTARNLGLDVVVFDPAEHYNKVRNQWFGLD